MNGAARIKPGDNVEELARKLQMDPKDIIRMRENARLIIKQINQKEKAEKENRK